MLTEKEKEFFAIYRGADEEGKQLMGDVLICAVAFRHEFYNALPKEPKSRESIRQVVEIFKKRLEEQSNSSIGTTEKDQDTKREPEQT